MGDKEIMWLKEISKADVPLVGGKGANLGEMYNAKLPIPPGFCVAANAYKRFLEETKLEDKIYPLLDKLDVNDTEKLQKVAEYIQNIILHAKMPISIKEEIIEAYNNLNVDIDVYKLAGKQALSMIKAGRDLPYVAVRSSATAEDLPEASFAGQNKTFLNVRGAEDVVIAAQRCWASLFTARSIYYRIKNNFKHRTVLIAVVIQKMVNSTRAGVAFSINPSTNNEDEVVIEAGWGLGDAVVAGQITPDNYIIDKKSLEIKKIKLNEQEFEYVRDSKLGRTVKKSIPEGKRNIQILSVNEIKRLAKLVVDIERHYQKAQDIEWAVEDGRLFIVQTRPVTTIKKVSEKPSIKEEKEEIPKNVILSGLSASPGVGSGPVKIVHDITDLSKIQKGDVLVAKMTNPDYVAAMERATAIVTNEGGTTCIGKGAKILTDVGFMDIEKVHNQIKNHKKSLKTLSLNCSTLKLEWRDITDAQTRRADVFVNNIYLQSTNAKENLIKITPDHKMMSLKNLKIIKKELSQVYKDGESLFSIDKIPLIKEKYATVSTNFMYVGGVMLSDGSIAYRNNRPIGVRFSQKPEPSKLKFIENFTQLFNKEFGCDFKHYGVNKFSKTLEFSINRKFPAQKIHNLKENIIDFMLYSNEQEITSFLAGYADGDGHLNKEKHWLEIYTDSRKKKLIEGLIIAGMRLNIPVRFKGTRNNCSTLIFPKSKNLQKILQKCKRINTKIEDRKEGLKLFGAKQLIGHLKDIDWRGWLYNYIKDNRLIDINKLVDYIKDSNLKKTLQKFKNSDLSMIRSELITKEQKTQVYNLTVKANSELDHNYIIFTEKYTPLVVGNCHAAIVSREMGIPCIVATEKATQVLKDSQLVTVDGTRGKVYGGKVEIKKEEKAPEEITGIESIDTITEVKVIMDLPKYAEKAAQTGADGVGLLRCEFMILQEKEHPIYLIQQNRKNELVEDLAKNISIIASAFKGKPVWYRTLDAPTDEFRRLKGGENEPEEDNPMMGWRSIRRSLDQPELLQAEFEAIKKVHDAGLTNVGVMIPLVTDVEQVKKAKEYLKKIGLEPQENIDFGVMIETPASVQIIKELCEEGLDFISFGTNDLTQFTLAVDRNNAKIQKLYNEMHPAVLRQIEYVIKVCREYNVETSICGQAGSDPEMAEFLVKAGIDSITANPDAVASIRRIVARAEKRLLLNVARSKIK